MRPLLWKEIRENWKWAAILFLGVSVSFVIWALEELGPGRIDESLASGDVLAILLFPTTIGATALGVLQIVPELKRDVWAFLIHRPVSATRIFLAKTIAGTGLYLAAVLVPFFVLALLVAAGAPERRVFHPSMLWPGAAIILAGAGFHGAGMMVAIRRARLGTRLLPVWFPAGTLAVTFFWILDVKELPSAPLLVAILVLQAIACAAAARVTARRRGFSRSERRLWIVLGALFGPAGLVALAGTRDWYPAEPCAACGRPRSVSLERCPRCGAGVEPPARDGTEVIEEVGQRDLIGSQVRSNP